MRLAEALSKREMEVTELVAEGLSNAAIAQKLNIECRTVERHLTNIGKALCIESKGGATNSRAMLVRLYMQDGPCCPAPCCAVEKDEALRSWTGRLSPRLMETVKLIAEGHSDGDIARRMGIKRRTVQHQISEIGQVLNLDGSRSGPARRVMLARLYLQEQASCPGHVSCIGTPWWCPGPA